MTGARESRLRVWIADAAQAARALLATPRYSIPAFVSLALGVGASTAVFAIFSAIMLRPLPYPREDELVRARQTVTGGTPNEALSYPFYADLKELTDLFSSVSVWTDEGVVLTGMGEARHASGAAVTLDFFDTLGVTAEEGRTFTAGGPSPDGADVAILGHSYWQLAFGGADVLGKTLVVNGTPHTVVGVIADDAALPAGKDLWTPIKFPEQTKNERGLCFFNTIARLAPAVPPALARERLESITKARGFHNDDGTAAYLSFLPLRDTLLGDRRTSALLMLSAVGAFLLLACANVAALLVTRASVRGRELAVRAAVGAGPLELARQAGFEALVLALAGGGAGLAMAWGLVQAANRFYPDELRYAPAHLDGRVLLAFAAIGLVSSLAIGVAPTLYALHVRPMDSLRADGRSTSSRGARRVREALVAAQVAITLALLVSAAVLVRSVRELHAVTPGFDPNVVTAEVSYPTSRKGAVLRRAFSREVLDRVAHAPGVAGAALAGDVPFDGDDMALSIDTGPGAIRTNVPTALRFVSPEYFETMAIPRLSGRTFTPADADEGVHRVIVNRAYGARNLGTPSAVGRRLSFGETEGDAENGAPIWYEIVGVVEDALDEDVTALPAPAIYLPFESSANPRTNGFTLIARGPLEAPTLMQIMGSVTRATDPGATVFRVAVMSSMMERSYRGRTALEQLLGLFAIASLMLAAIGLFGVTSYTVAERSGEIGIRRALGASQGDILGMILGETAVLVAAGVVVGVACALGTRSLLTSFLFGVAAGDVSTYVSVSAGVFAMALCAALAPARAAATVAPSRALQVR